MYKLIQSGHKNLLILYVFTACSSGGSNPVEMIPSQNLVSETAPSISNSIAIDSNLDLIWQDEFTQKMIDDEKWVFQLGDGSNFDLPGWGNNELQFYTNNSSNYELSNGLLKIIPLHDDIAENTYTSAKLITKNKFNFSAPGIIEIKFKTPQGRGLWPAIWMMPVKNKYGNWPRSGEIDLMEARGSNTQKILSTLHFYQNGHMFDGGEYNESQGANFNNVFHTISLVWNKSRVSFFVDKEHLVFETSLNNSLGDVYPFNEDFYLILNVAVGGNFVQSPVPAEICNSLTCEDSQKLIIDYVRFYQ